MKTILQKSKISRETLIKNPTPSERVLKKAFNENDISFKSQFIICPYIVDFYLRKRGIIIELDGYIHNKGHNIEHGSRRDLYFLSMGLIPIHFNNYHKASAIISIIKQCKELDKIKQNAIDRRVSRINEMYGQTGYQEKSIQIKNPDDWKVVFNEHKKQLKKPKKRTKS